MKKLAFVVILLSACRSENDLPIVEDEPIERYVNVDSIRLVRVDSVVCKGMMQIGLVDVKYLDDRILVDLRYSTENNFMKTQLYDSMQRLFLQRDVAARLSKVQDYLDSLKPGYRLLIFDGVRPVQVQKEMWDALDSIPILNRGKFVSNPALGSVHNFGAAVDLTIVDDSGVQLDMGAGYDDFRPIAFPSKESEFLKSGELTREQYQNRLLLRKIMRSQRFSNIPSEWWHFNAYSRITASHKYQQLLNESGQGRWFKVIVSDSLKSDSTGIGID